MECPKIFKDDEDREYSLEPVMLVPYESICVQNGQKIFTMPGKPLI
jgi:hypothetical protein